ncbi:MAG: hypothetical protein PHP43_06385 [Methanoculleus sp.]|nr:hypothetical protein [Methanoculleus sp.]
MTRMRKRGLASADEATRQRVASAGGRAPHGARGLQGADEETRKRVALTGGRSPHEKRGSRKGTRPGIGREASP